jgi:hypothetical protein
LHDPGRARTQKPIVVGKGGDMIKQIDGSSTALEAHFETRVPRSSRQSEVECQPRQGADEINIQNRGRSTD